MADKIVSWGGYESKGTSGMSVTGSMQILYTTTSVVHGEGNTLLELRGINGSSGTNNGRFKIGYNENDPSVRLNSDGVSVNTGRWTFLPQIWFVGGITSNHNTAFTLDGMTNGVLAGTAGDIIKFTQRNGQFASFYDAGSGLSEFRIWQQSNSSKYIYLKPGQETLFNLSPVTIKGSGTTSSTTSLLVQNANASTSLVVLDNGNTTIYGSGSNDTSSALTVTSNNTTDTPVLKITNQQGRGGYIRAHSANGGAGGLVFGTVNQGAADSGFVFGNSIGPGSNLTYNLGNDGQVWANVYAQTIRSRDNTSQGTLNLRAGTTSNPLNFYIGDTYVGKFNRAVDGYGFTVLTGSGDFKEGLTVTGSLILSGSATTTEGGYATLPSTLYVEDSIAVFTDLDGTASINLKGSSTNKGMKGIYFYHNSKKAWIESYPKGSGDTGGLRFGSYGITALDLGQYASTFALPVRADVFEGTGINSGTHYYNFNSSERALRIASTRLGSNGSQNLKIMMRIASTSTDATDSDTFFYVPGTNRNVSINSATTDLGATLGIRGSGTTSSTTSLLVRNGAGSQMLAVTDDGITTANTIFSKFIVGNSPNLSATPRVIKPLATGYTTGATPGGNTGAIRITTPGRGNNHMIKYIFDVYAYGAIGFTVEAWGYDNGSWSSMIAKSTDPTVSVSFAYDVNGKAVLYIGDFAKTWGAYAPSVVVREVEIIGWQGNAYVSSSAYYDPANYEFVMTGSFGTDTVRGTITNTSYAVSNITPSLTMSLDTGTPSNPSAPAGYYKAILNGGTVYLPYYL